MPPIEFGASRPVGPVQVKAAATGSARPAAPARTDTPSAAAQVERSDALNPGEAAPVDAERVAVIRSAIERGAYPVVPARIADAMIAAQMLLRTPQV